jgi:hypothetical protein
MHLRGEAQASPRIVVRRFVPPAISTQDCRQDVSDPASGMRSCSRPCPAGSLTSCLRVWQPPTLPSAKIA